MQSAIKGLSLIVTLVLFAGCGQKQTQKTKKVDVGPEVTSAIATIHAAKGEDLSGVVRFSQQGDEVKVNAQITNISAGKHGFHIHTYGDCSDMEGFQSAGGHYNPTNKQHGAPTADMRHVGDLGNLVAGSEGKADLTITDPVISLNGKHSIIGRAVIIHAGADDFESQPSGAAGPRIGCGVIGIKSTKADTAKKSM